MMQRDYHFTLLHKTEETPEAFQGKVERNLERRGFHFTANEVYTMLAATRARHDHTYQSPANDLGYTVAIYRAPSVTEAVAYEFYASRFDVRHI